RRGRPLGSPAREGDRDRGPPGSAPPPGRAGRRGRRSAPLQPPGASPGSPPERLGRLPPAAAPLPEPGRCPRCEPRSFIPPGRRGWGGRGGAYVEVDCRGRATALERRRSKVGAAPTRNPALR